MQPLYLNLNPHTARIPVFFTRELWPELTAFLQEHYPKNSVYLITDSHILPHYREAVHHACSALPAFRGMLSFPAGERSKNRLQKSRLEDALLQDLAGRDTVLLAMGGGVTGDLAGFVAASIHRGIHLIHIPTSVIAQVDSSIGGKVGINHPAGKNLLGSFYQPRAVFVNVKFLQTLPEDELINGMAEVIKYGVMLDPELWEWLENEQEMIFSRDFDTLERIVRRCIALKIKVVEKDENESDYRSILNFGHTVGHALEKMSGFRIKHGYAIASGMRVAAMISRQVLGYPPAQVRRIRQLLDRYRFPAISWERYPLDRIWEIICSDKKARERTPRFTLLDARGNPQLFYPVSREELADALAAG